MKKIYTITKKPGVELIDLGKLFKPFDRIIKGKKEEEKKDASQINYSFRNMRKVLPKCCTVSYN